MHGVQNHFTFPSNLAKNLEMVYQENICFIQWRRFPRTGFQNTFESQQQFWVIRQSQSSIYDVRENDGVSSVRYPNMLVMKFFMHLQQVRFLTSMQLSGYDQFRKEPIQAWLQMECIPQSGYEDGNHES